MKKQLNEIKRMQQLAGVINESQLGEEQYAEPMVMIQNIVDNWADGGIDAEAAMTRIDKILQGKYEDESGEGFMNENQLVGNLFSSTEDNEYEWNESNMINVIRSMGYDDPEEVANEIATISSPYDFLEMMRNKTGNKDLDIADLTLDMFKQSVKDEF